MSRRLPHLPALDGLRALAVALVVAYHLELGWATGGFIGVDIFFVISGFLITRLLLDERSTTGRIALGEFWVRRFKRLVPALVVMIAATLVATRRWGLPEQWNSVRLDAIAGLAYVANWRFVFDQQSYFEAALGPSPLLHTWSLAVEEQWYLLWPIAMVGLVALAARLRRGAGIAAASVIAAAVVSAGLMAIMFEPTDPSRAYFGTDTRAQHLLIGAALAWLVELFPDLIAVAERRRLRLPFSAALVVLVVLAATIHDTSGWLYRGGLFAISIVAAVVVLGTASPRPDAALGWMGRQPLTWIGQRSYGIYLWHWPVIVFVGASIDIGLSGTPLIVVQVAITLALAEISFRFVESPVRRSNAPSRRLVGAWSIGACVVAGLGFVALTTPADRRLAPTAAIFPNLDDPASTTPPNGVVADADEPNRTGDPTNLPSDRRRVLLLGDSAAYSLAQQLDPSTRPDWDTQAFVQVGCPLTPGETLDADSSTTNAVNPDCLAWQTAWPDFGTALQPDIVVVMIGAWEVLDHRVDGRDIRFPSPEWEALVGRTLGEAADAAGSSGAPVVLLDVACMGAGPDNPGTASRSDPDRVRAVNALIEDVASSHTDVTVAALSSVVCPDGVDGLEIDGDPVRYDGVHYTRAGAALVWPWLFDQLDQRLDPPPATGDE